MILGYGGLIFKAINILTQEMQATAVIIHILIWKKRSALSDLLLTTKEVHGTGTSSLLLLSQTDLKQFLLLNQ